MSTLPVDRMTEAAHKVLELSLREALSLGHNYIGTEHLLLALVRENKGLGARVLRDLGLDGEVIRHEVIRQLYGQRKPPGTPGKVNDLLVNLKAAIAAYEDAE